MSPSTLCDLMDIKDVNIYMRPLHVNDAMWGYAFSVFVLDSKTTAAVKKLTDIGAEGKIRRLDFLVVKRSSRVAKKVWRLARGDVNAPTVYTFLARLEAPVTRTVQKPQRGFTSLGPAEYNMDLVKTVYNNLHAQFDANGTWLSWCDQALVAEDDSMRRLYERTIRTIVATSTFDFASYLNTLAAVATRMGSKRLLYMLKGLTQLTAA